MYGDDTFKDGVSRREVPLFDQRNIPRGDLGITGYGHAINSENMNLKDRMQNNVQIEELVIVEDVTDNMPSGIPSSGPIPQVEVVAEEWQHAIASSKNDDDARSNGPDLANEVCLMLFVEHPIYAIQVVEHIMFFDLKHIMFYHWK
jgi:hypothetical protein